MPRRHPYRKFWSRCALGGRSLRLRWRAADKYPLILASLSAGIVGIFGLVLYSIHTTKVDQRHLRCLALNVYYEARGEPEAGQYAVAKVTMNRVASRRYPATVCDVVYEQNWDSRRKRRVGAFSWTELERLPQAQGREWDRAVGIAREVYYQRHDPLQLADVLHYHADYIEPRWSRSLTPVARIGNHVFYR